MARSFGQLDTSWYNGREDLVLEKTPHLFLHLLAEIGPGIIHSEHNPARRLITQPRLYHFYDLYELAHSLQGVEFCLQWYQEQRTWRETVNSEQAQAGWVSMIT